MCNLMEHSARDARAQAAAKAAHAATWAPHLVTVFCDSCGDTATGDYAVADDKDPPAVARNYLATRQGWKIAAGLDLCPECAAGKPPVDHAMALFLTYRAYRWCQHEGTETFPHDWDNDKCGPRVQPTLSWQLEQFHWDALDAGIIQPKHRR